MIIRKKKGPHRFAMAIRAEFLTGYQCLHRQSSGDRAFDDVKGRTGLQKPVASDGHSARALSTSAEWVSDMFGHVCGPDEHPRGPAQSSRASALRPSSRTALPTSGP